MVRRAHPTDSTQRAIEDVAERVDRLAVLQHLVVEVVAGRVPGVADVADEVAAPYALAGLHGGRREVAVARGEAEAVRDDDGVPQVAVRAGEHDRSEERRVGKECRSRWAP